MGSLSSHLLPLVALRTKNQMGQTGETRISGCLETLQLLLYKRYRRPQTYLELIRRPVYCWRFFLLCVCVDTIVVFFSPSSREWWSLFHIVDRLRRSFKRTEGKQGAFFLLLPSSSSSDRRERAWKQLGNVKKNVVNMSVWSRWTDVVPSGPRFNGPLVWCGCYCFLNPTTYNSIAYRHRDTVLINPSILV